MDNQLLLARRYAQAFINVFGKSLTFKDYQHIKKAQDFFNHNYNLLSLLKVQLIDPIKKIEMLKSVLVEKYHINDSIIQLIELLARDKRTFLIDHVLQYIADLYQEKHTIHIFTIMTSGPINDESREIIKKFLSHLVPHAIIDSYTIKKELIAGIAMQSHSLLWEYSIAKDLRTLRQLYR